MKFSYISPYVRYACDGYVYPPYTLTDRMIFDYELLYVKEGEIRLTLGGKTYTGKPKDLFLICPGEVHSIDFITLPSVRQPHIHFDLFYQEDSPSVPVSLKPVSKFTPEEKQMVRKNRIGILPVAFPSYIHLRNPAAFEALLFEIIKVFEQNLPYAELEMKGLMISLLVCLSREINWANNPEWYKHINLVTEIGRYLTANTDREITLDQLSEQFNINKYYLIRLFKENYQETPIHFHLKKRLDAAKQLLQFTNFSITEVSEKTGFPSIHTFCRSFKNTEGMSPKVYREHGHL